MPVESIGACGISRGEWSPSEMELGICYIRQACGEPPHGYELEIVEQDHDLGPYSMIGLTWEGPNDAPWEYLRRAEAALMRFQEAIDWEAILPATLIENDNDENEEDGSALSDEEK